MDIHYRRAYAFGGKQLPCLQSHIYHDTGSKDAYVLTLGKCYSLTRLELVALFIEKHRDGVSAEAEVHGSLIVYRPLDGGSRLGRIGGVDDRHSGDRTHKRKVLKALVSRAVLPYRDPGVSRADLHIEVRITDTVPYLLEGASRREHGKGRGKNDLSRRRDTRGDRHHIALCNSAVKESLGELLFEDPGLCRRGKVGVKHHEIVFVAEFGKRVAVCFSRCYLIRHLSCPP